MGGVFQAIEKGFLQKEIADSAYKYQKEIERKERTVVGLNEYVGDGTLEISLLKVSPEVEEVQLRKLRKTRENRGRDGVQRTLGRLRQGAEENRNLMPYILDCVKAHCTLGEICQILRETYGEYQELVAF